MASSSNAGLEAMGLKAARAVIGDGVKRVAVRYGEDSTMHPVHVFFFLIERYRDGQSIGEARLRLIQRLRDELLAAGDHHSPAVQMLDPADWGKVLGLVGS